VAGVGLCVMIVAVRSGRSAAAMAMPVVPPSRMTVVPGTMSSAASPLSR